MIMSLRESKAKLSELVERASRGEDVLITVRGRIKARLTSAEAQEKKADRKAWLKELRKLRKKNDTGRVSISIEKILREQRGD